MSKYTIQQIKKAVESKGYKWFNDTSNKGYDVNIVGVRNSSTNGIVTNRFDDSLTVSYKDLNGKWCFHCFDATTDPGSHWEKNLLNKDGVAILKPGQYRGSHKIGLHQGRYEALKQQRAVKVYRDNNRDGKYDLTKRMSTREFMELISIEQQSGKEENLHKLTNGQLVVK